MLQGCHCCQSLLTESGRPLSGNAGGKLNPKHDIRRRDEYIPPDHWGITKSDLLEFYAIVKKGFDEGTVRVPPNSEFYKPAYDKPDIGPSVYVVTDTVIVPMAEENDGLSYALIKHPDGFECTAFVSHAFAEGIFEFINKLKRSWPMAAMGMYVCFLSNPQIGVEALLDVPLEDSPFNRALENSDQIVVVPNHHGSIYTRLWCVFEAYRAMELAHQRGHDVTITLSYSMPKRYLFVEVFLGLVLAIGGIIFSYYVLARQNVLGHSVVRFCGPMMWLLNGFLLCSLLSLLGRAAVKLAEGHCTCFTHRCAYIFQVIMVYMQVVLWALASGCTLYHILGAIKVHSEEYDNDFADFLGHFLSAPHDEVRRTIKFSQDYWFSKMLEVGEEFACLLLAIAMMLVFFQHIFTVFVREVLRKEGHKLDFNTVREATAANPRDQQRLLDAIGDDNADRVDHFIFLLRTIGRYNKGIHANIVRGIDWKVARNSDLPYMLTKTMTAVLAWEFWWLADLSGHNMLQVAFPLVIMSTTAAFLIICIMGDHAMFAVDVFFWMGLLFAFSSNASSFWQEKYVNGMRMSWPTLPLQASLVALSVLACFLFYTYRLKALFEKVHACKGKLEQRKLSMLIGRQTSRSGYSSVESSTDTGNMSMRTVRSS